MINGINLEMFLKCQDFQIKRHNKHPEKGVNRATKKSVTFKFQNLENKEKLTNFL